MRILALDTAQDVCAVCVLDSDEGVLAEQSVPMQRGHAEALLPLARDVVGQAGGFSLIDRIATTVGPGSFTGLRVAISAGRAFGVALRVPCVGVSSLAALAAPVIAEGNSFAVAAAIDARHGNIYFQLFSARGQSLVDARCVSLRDAAKTIGSSPVHVIGPGAALLADEARLSGVDVVQTEVVSAPDIVWVARLGTAADPQTAMARPAYLKPADATPSRSGRVARQ